MESRKPDAGSLFLVSILFAVVGVQLLGTGILAEIMVRAWFEASGRASYTVVERIGFRANALLSGPDRSPQSGRTQQRPSARS